MSLAIKKVMNTMGNEYGGIKIVEGNQSSRIENQDTKVESGRIG